MDQSYLGFFLIFLGFRAVRSSFFALSYTREGHPNLSY